eukprot:CAMPEP_0198251994 /NCGR_PEP_ID=MMETSP1447-20131203/2635_1 /TAXON_ID=420782 /ORGANISM="Chaetoceros dichaeta, Strain CCMP1751" /LENGTH=688 /DNA_ID=CAMNT_0043937135 /DNA_START=14 /DNA_END=2080 /DNA_ORIENTATION=-
MKYKKASLHTFEGAELKSNPNPNPFEHTYELGRKIGKGCFGSVHIARNRKRDEFAAKVIDRSQLKGEDHLVLYEAHVLRKLSSHPNIISLVDFFVSPEFYHVILELARGGDLFDKLAKRNSYTERDARYLAKDILTAISYIHSKDFVHRDLKPENLLLEDDADDAIGVKVADFGFAKNLSDAPTPAGLVTRCGTPAYVAPELIRGIPYGKSVDVWGCGVILFLLLGGKQPFRGKEQQDIYRKIIAGDFTFHTKCWDPISIEAKQLITRMLAVDPKLRITADDALNSSWMAINDENESISLAHLDFAIEGLRKVNAKRRFKAAAIATTLARRLPTWDPSRVSFTSEDTADAIPGDTMNCISNKKSVRNSSQGSKTLDKGNIGQEFDDIYFLQSELKNGNLSTVWKGEKKSSGEIVAIKVIARKNSIKNDADVLSEVAILHSLRHKYVVKLHNYFEEPSRFLMIMEFMSGGDVINRVRENSSYTEKDTRELSKSLLTAIAYIHSCDVAHRDIKPENLLLETRRSNCRIKVADFGFARRVHAPLSLTTRCGTPTYVAPEILKNHPHDESADMWSVGVIMYLLLVGYPPFKENKQQELFQKIRLGYYEFQPDDWKDISEQAKDMIQSLLVVDPAHRYSAEKSLQHEWISNMDDSILLNTDLSGSQRHLMTYASYSSQGSEESPWVACSSLPN